MAERDGLASRDIVGWAHVIVGAFGLLTSAFGVLFAANGVGQDSLILHGAAFAMGAATVLAGLWLRDGRWYGAALAAVLDGARLVLALVSARGVSFDGVLATVLLVAVLWIWPIISDGPG